MTQSGQAVCWAFVATALFSVVAALAKLTAAEYHVLQILLFRQIVVLLSTLPGISRDFPRSLSTRFPVLHGVRLVGAFVALSTGIWAVAVLPLVTATTLFFSQVFFVTLLAAIALKESIGLHRIVAVIVGFTGVLVVMQPGFGSPTHWTMLIPLVGALGAAIAVTAVRKLSQTESTATLLSYQSVFVGVLAMVPMPWLWKTPDGFGLLMLVSMGILATFGQWAGVRALRMGEASMIGNIEYMKIVYTALLGYVLFMETPQLHTLTGAMLIVGSTAYMLYRERLHTS